MHRPSHSRLIVLLAALATLAACDSGPSTPTAPAPPTTTTVATATAVPVATFTVTSVAPTEGVTETQTPTGSIEVVARTLITEIAQGEYDNAIASFNSTMAQELPASRLETTWNQLIAQFGPFQEQGAAQITRQDPYDIVTILCVFEKGNLNARVVLNSDRRVAGLFFAPAPSSTPGATVTSSYQPPDYVNTNSFTERELSFGDPDWILTGTLTMPNTEGPHPAVVLVQGSGPSDRDETIGPNKPFRDLAWGLASQGIAVFRYDKRTFTYQAKLATIRDEITIDDEVVDDAISALALLVKTEDIDPGRVFLLGHSLGAYMAPKIAQISPDEHGFIALAAEARPLEDLILDQYTYLANLDGSISPDEQKQLDALKDQINNVKNLQPGSTVPAEQLPLNVPATYWLSLQGYSSTSFAADLHEPMLFLQGERDYQVTMTDFEDWQQALAGKEDAMLKSYPDLNHLFMEGSQPPTPADYETPGHVAAPVIQDIDQWIVGH